MKCPYHPDEDSHPVRIMLESGHEIRCVTCPECEWNPPDIPEMDGRTCPDIDTMGWPTD